jgi:hypothetical protein
LDGLIQPAGGNDRNRAQATTFLPFSSFMDALAFWKHQGMFLIPSRAARRILAQILRAAQPGEQ